MTFQFLILYAAGMAVPMMLVFSKTNCKTCRTVRGYWAILVIRAFPSHTFPSNRPEERFNNAHEKTRNFIERDFGVWKRRFPILKYGLKVKLENCPDIIVAGAELHNITIQLDEEIFLPDVAEDARSQQHTIVINANNALGNMIILSVRTLFTNVHLICE